MKKANTIHLIFTGGTIDSHYDGSKDTVTPNNHSSIPEYIKGLKLYMKFKFTEICMKDSRNLTIRDRNAILDAVEKSPADMVIITHGTYTMPDTARFLAQKLRRHNQKIILTGSMLPLRGFDSTDAPFNLGYAIANLQNIENGIYVCMNGMIFTAEEVAKNVPEGRFYSLFKQKQ